MKGLMILANGFEDAEAIVTLDILKRSQLQMITATPNKLLNIASQSKLCVQVDQYLDQVRLDEFNFLVIPGGKAVFNELRDNELVDKVIKHFIDNKKWVAAICAAPLLLGRLGYLSQHHYTCFPGCEAEVIGGRLHKDPVVVSGQIITGKAMYYSHDFALVIIEQLQGKAQKDAISASLKGEK